MAGIYVDYNLSGHLSNYTNNYPPGTIFNSRATLRLSRLATSLSHPQLARGSRHRGRLAGSMGRDGAPPSRRLHEVFSCHATKVHPCQVESGLRPKAPSFRPRTIAQAKPESDRSC